MRALITGATGFVGRHLARHLAAGGAQVFALARPASDTSMLADASMRDGAVTVLRADHDPEAIAAAVAVAAPDVTFHLASLFRAEHRPADIGPLVEANLTFGTFVLDALARHGHPRVVNTGTAWQHFGGAAYDPVCLYAATKEAFEALAAFYVQAHGLRVVTLKLFDTYGPDDPRGKVVALLMRAAATGEPLLLSPGDQEIDLVHIDDVVAAFALAAERLLAGTGTGAGHERYAVSSGRPLPLRGLAQVVAGVAGRPINATWGVRPYRRREVMAAWRDGAALPGWTPRVDLTAGLTALWAGAPRDF